MLLPNTYIIGIQKAGTTSLHNWLAQHFDIYAPLEFKDVDYFANPEVAIRARERLLKDFSDHEGESVILQSQVNYLFYPEAIARIKELTPQAKLIVILRDPVDRAISAYRYFTKMGREDRAINDALLYEPKTLVSYSRDNNDFTYLEHGMYGQQLEVLYKKFSSDKVLVLQFEELKTQPEKMISKVFGFLDVDKNFTPSFEQKNKTGKVRFSWLQKKLTDTNRLRKKMIKYLFNWWLPAEKRQLFKKQLIELNTEEKKAEELVSQKMKKKLHAYFEEDQKKLLNILEKHTHGK